ncbi:YdcF family protein [Dyella sp. 2RAB6]|uniref:YdcF family protein n=1 Tax=Dyella sp. 2RAB6 TaxID=3232992 RepID=UPI003F929264
MFDLVNLSISHPITQAWLLGAIGLLCLVARRYRLGLGVAAMAPLWLLLCATPAFAHGLQRWLEEQYVTQPAVDYPKADAIVVLGGEALADEKESWRDEGGDAVANSRVGFGYLLFRAGRAPLVLLSGEGDAARMATMLERQGVPATAVRQEGTSRTTYENARNSAALLRGEGARTILLVTSPGHMPRAAASFEKQGFQVIPAPALLPPVRVPGSDWEPRRAVLWDASHTLHEYIGLWVYRLRGWA